MLREVGNERGFGWDDQVVRPCRQVAAFGAMTRAPLAGKALDLRVHGKQRQFGSSLTPSTLLLLGFIVLEGFGPTGFTQYGSWRQFELRDVPARLSR